MSDWIEAVARKISTTNPYGSRPTWAEIALEIRAAAERAGVLRDHEAMEAARQLGTMLLVNWRDTGRLEWSPCHLPGSRHDDPATAYLAARDAAERNKK